MTFDEFLKKKRIDAGAFQKAEASRWQEWKTLFDEMGPLSFDHFYKFQFNPLRRTYLLAVTPISAQPVKARPPLKKIPAPPAIENDDTLTERPAKLAPPLKKPLAEPVLKPPPSDGPATEALPPQVKKPLTKPVMKPPQPEAPAANASEEKAPPIPRKKMPFVKPVMKKDDTSHPPA